MFNKVVAIFGGSFNPIHVGHIALAKSVVQAHLADEVWLLVSPQNPLKEQNGLQPEQVRLRLANEALANEQHIHVSDFEFHLPRPSYTWKTLNALQQSYPTYEFKLLIGADNWLIFNKWANYKEILDNHKILVYPRPDSPINQLQLPSNVTLIKSPLCPFSSTDIRQRVRNKESIKDMVPSCVEQEVVKIYNK